MFHSQAVIDILDERGARSTCSCGRDAAPFHQVCNTCIYEPDFDTNDTPMAGDGSAEGLDVRDVAAPLLATCRMDSAATHKANPVTPSTTAGTPMVGSPSMDIGMGVDHVHSLCEHAHFVCGYCHDEGTEARDVSSTQGAGFYALSGPVAAFLIGFQVVSFVLNLLCAIRMEHAEGPEGYMYSDDQVRTIGKGACLGQFSVLVAVVIYAVGASDGTKYSAAVHKTKWYLIGCSLFFSGLAVTCGGFLPAGVNDDVCASLITQAVSFLMFSCYAWYPYWLIYKKLGALPPPKHKINRITPWICVLIPAVCGFGITNAYRMIVLLGHAWREEPTIAAVKAEEVAATEGPISVVLLTIMISGFGLMGAVRQTVKAGMRSFGSSQSEKAAAVVRILRTHELFAYLALGTLMIHMFGVSAWFIVTPMLPIELAARLGARPLMCMVLVDDVGNVASVMLMGGILDLFLRRVSPQCAEKLGIGDGSGDAAHYLDSMLEAAILDTSKQIEFLGNILPDDSGSVECISSFPGKYPSGWAQVVSGRHNMSAACVFTMEAESGLGEHVVDPDHPEGKCYCASLYGKRPHKQLGYLITLQKRFTDERRQKTLDLARAMNAVVVEETASPEAKDLRDQEAKEMWEKQGHVAAWGCKWFQMWKDNLEIAVARNQKLSVYYFEGQKGEGKVEWEQLSDPSVQLWDGVGLGGSQKGEVAHLDRMRKLHGSKYDYVEYDTGDFLRDSGAMNASMPLRAAENQSTGLFVAAVLMTVSVPVIIAALVWVV